MTETETRIVQKVKDIAEERDRLKAQVEELRGALLDITAAYHGLTLGRQDTEFEGQFKVRARKVLAATKPEVKP